MSKLKKLPVGIQTFKTIIEEDYLYIDKTKEAFELLEGNQRIFLSRPRRFGKSLFLDTLKNICEGNKELFKGLYIYDKYDFVKYPVIKIDWSGDVSTLEGAKEKIMDTLRYNQEILGIKCLETSSPSSCFDYLIKETYKKYGEKVVILVDEYDKPILDTIGKPEVAEANRELLRSLYVMIKANDEFIKLAFLTGISKFSKASIFSGLNNLEDISLNSKFGDICGYTQEDIETSFMPYLTPASSPTLGEGRKKDGVKDLLIKIKEWYNGYYFLESKIYNPFDILLFIKNNLTFENYWFSTATPNFLIEVLKKKEYFIPKLENLVVGKELIDTFDINNIKLETLLFQSGYLTIAEKYVDNEFDLIEYRLKVPNKEVQISLNKLFFDYLSNGEAINIRDSLESLASGKLDNFLEILVSLFASIPYNNYTNNKIYEYEGFYASIIYTYLASLGVRIIAEDVTNLGRIDLTLFIRDKIYVLEFKVCFRPHLASPKLGEGEEQKNVIGTQELTNNALEQIKEKKYYEKYLVEDKQIYLLGIEFNKKDRNISNFKWEKIK